MPMKLRGTALSALMLGGALTPAAAWAQDLKVSGSVRVRYEAIEGQPHAGFGVTDEQLAIRSAILAEYDPKGPLTFGVQLQDSRVYLAKAGGSVNNGDVNAFEVNQAYLALDLGAAMGQGTKTRLQAGRFLTNVGSRRLVAGDEYRNASNAYTGLRLDAAGPINATLFYLLPQVRLPDAQAEVLRNKVQVDREGFDLQLWGGLLGRPRLFGKATGEIGYVGLAERDVPGRPTRDRNLHSVDVRLLLDPRPGKFDFEAEAIYQFGTISTALAANAASQDVSASFLHARAGYTFPGGWKPRVGLEYDRVSGDGPGGGYGRFDTLYGMRRTDFAPLGAYTAVGRANISSPGVRVEATPDPRWDVMATYRPMWLADKTDAFSTSGVRDASGRSGSFAGHQLDGRLRFWILPRRLRAEADATFLLKGEFMRNAPNAPRTGDTHYASIALTFTY